MNIQPLLISGPSGIGKSYLANYLTVYYDCSRVIPTTTRPPRINERDEIDYRFLSEQEYRIRQDENKFFMSNYFLKALYGFEYSSVESVIARGLVPVCEIYTPFVEQFVSAYPNSVSIYLLPENEHLLLGRLRQRGDSISDIQYRYQEGIKERQLLENQMACFYKEVYTVTKDNFTQIVSDLERKHSLTRAHKERYK